MDADGSNQELLGNPDTFDTEPRISPDGTQVVFTRLTFGGGNQQQTIMVRDLASGEERTIEAAGTAPEHPNWSPDGEWIIYDVASWMTDEIPNDQLERIAADGSGEPEVLLEATLTQGASAWYSATAAASSSAASGRTPDAACLMDADSEPEILVDEPGVHDNHFSWGVAASAVLGPRRHPRPVKVWATDRPRWHERPSQAARLLEMRWLCPADLGSR
jgi:dipeptidyl aminopeptidase/acylaminoacyl peptidase